MWTGKLHKHLYHAINGNRNFCVRDCGIIGLDPGKDQCFSVRTNSTIGLDSFVSQSVGWEREILVS